MSFINEFSKVLEELQSKYRLSKIRYKKGEDEIELDFIGDRQSVVIAPEMKEDPQANADRVAQLLYWSTDEYEDEGR